VFRSRYRPHHGVAAAPSTRTHGSLLELLHHTGAPTGLRVLGSGLPEGVRPSREDGRADVVVLAPRGRMETSEASLRAMTKAATGALEDGGLVVVAAPWRIRRRLDPLVREVGLEPLGARLLLMRGGALVSAERGALRHLVALVPTRWRTVTSRLAPLWPPALGAVSRATLTAYGSRGTSLAGWLRSNRVGPDGGLVIVPSWRGADGSAVVTRIGAGGSLVAKVGLGQETADVGMREARALELLGPSARAAGIHVPEVLDVVELAGRQAVILTNVPGCPAALSPGSVCATAESLARWLARWSSETRVDGDASSLVDAAVLRPLALLESDLPAAYVELVRRTVAEIGDGRAPVAAVHGDLTLWNVLVTRGKLGVVDWEVATDRSLPLVDLPYLLVDAVTCRDRARDRVAAYEACFGSAGSHLAWSRRIVDEVARDAGVAQPWFELAAHACWLGHAADERRRGLADGPFLRVLRMHAQGTR
jgi:Phosphotransferase enzyme family